MLGVIVPFVLLCLSIIILIKFDGETVSALIFFGCFVWLVVDFAMAFCDNPKSCQKEYTNLMTKISYADKMDSDDYNRLIKDVQSYNSNVEWHSEHLDSIWWSFAADRGIAELPLIDETLYRVQYTGGK